MRENVLWIERVDEQENSKRHKATAFFGPYSEFHT